MHLAAAVAACAVAVCIYVSLCYCHAGGAHAAARRPNVENLPDRLRGVFDYDVPDELCHMAAF